MSDETVENVPPAPPPLGPGETDPRSPAVETSSAASKPLGPGDDDPRSPVKGAAETTAGPLGPGDSTEDVDDLEMIAPAPPGPGDSAQTPRHVTHMPKRKPTLASVAPVETAPVAAVAAPTDEDKLTAERDERV